MAKIMIRKNIRKYRVSHIDRFQQVVEIYSDWPLLHLINPRYEVIFNVSVIFYTSEEDLIMPLSLKCFKSRQDDINTFEDNVIYIW